MALTGTGYGIDPADGYTETETNIYYMDAVSGNDVTGDGSTGAPWQTTAKIISTMASGDTFILRNGSYAQFSQADPTARTDWVTIKADTGHSPTMAGLSLINTSLIDTYLRFDGIDLIIDTNDLYIGVIEFVKYLEIRNGNINNSTHKYLTDSCLSITDSNTILIYGNDMSAASRSATITNTSNLTYSKNHIHGLSGSSPINYGSGNTNGIIERNNIYDSNFDTQDVDPNSPYLIESPGGWPHSSGVAIRSSDLIIRKNILHNVGSTAGISTYLPDAAGGESDYNDILIENNLLYDIDNNSIIQITNLGSNFIIRNNTVIGKERTDTIYCVYKFYTALYVISIGANSDGSGLSLINNIMMGSVFIPNLATTENNLFWSLVLQDAPSIWVTAANDADTVVSTNSGSDPSCPYTDFTTNFFTGINAISNFTANHGLTYDFSLDPSSFAVNFGDSTLQPDDALGEIVNGFIQETPLRSATNHSVGAYEYGLVEVISMSNQVQRDFINNAARPHVEAIIHILHELDSFVADYDALQATGDALALDAAVLNDGDDSTPRLDAPNLTGADIQTMRALSASMSLVVDATSRQSLIGKMVRNLTTVLKIN